MFACRSSTHTYFRRKGKVRKQARVTPQRHYHCYGMLREDMDCRKPAMIRAEQLEKLVWNQVKEMVQNPELIVAGIESLDAHDDFGVANQIAGAERDLQKVQVEEERGHPTVRVEQDHRGPARPAAAVHHRAPGSRARHAERPPRQGVDGV